MPRKNYRWLDVKATKSQEEWRRINRIYDKRRCMRKKLRIRGAELLDKVHSCRLVYSHEVADALSDEIHKALRLPYSWSQDDFDKAEACLDKVEAKVGEICRDINPKATALTNLLLLTMNQFGKSDGEKIDALMRVLEHVAAQMSLERVDSLEENEVNYIMTLLRTKDGYYPKWLVKHMYDKLTSFLNAQDIEKLTKMLIKVVVANKNRLDIARMVSVDKNDEVVIG